VLVRLLAPLGASCRLVARYGTVTAETDAELQAFFCVHGLALLGELGRVDRRQLVDWIYALQVHPDARDRGAWRRG